MARRRRPPTEKTIRMSLGRASAVVWAASASMRGGAGGAGIVSTAFAAAAASSRRLPRFFLPPSHGGGGIVRRSTTTTSSAGGAFAFPSAAERLRRLRRVVVEGAVDGTGTTTTTNGASARPPLPLDRIAVDRRVVPRFVPSSRLAAASPTRRAVSSSSESSSSSSSWDVVSSPKSNTVKLYKSLATKRKLRTETNRTILEGRRLVHDVLKDASTSRYVEHVLTTKDALERDDLGGRLRELLEEASNSSERRTKVVWGTEEALDACSDTVTTQGVVAIASLPAPFEPPPPPSPSSSSPSNDDRSSSRMYLVLDGLSDPGNVGTLLRTALASGVSGALLLPDCCDVWNPKAVRSAMGSTFRIPLRTVGSFDEACEFLGRCGVDEKDGIYAATMEEEESPSSTSSPSPPPSTPHYDVNWTDLHTALVLGKEGSGLSSDVRTAVKHGSIRSVHVPMEEDSIESLNAAVCGSVVMFERFRQRRCREASSSSSSSK